MRTNDHLFPHRLARRDFLKTGAAAAAGLALPGFARAQENKSPVRFGSGQHTYELDESWGQLPAGMKYGHGCALAVDSKDRIFVTSRSANPCVAIFDRDGKLLETWSKDFAEKIGYTTKQVADTAHGLYWSNEPGGEFLYWTENAPGNRVYKTDLAGKILYQLGNVKTEHAASRRYQFDNPTDVAVAANGDIYIVDGYGSQQVHRFDKNWRWLKTIGKRTDPKGPKGPEAPAYTFNTCHGVWISTLKQDPEVYIADRHNDRVEVFDLELKYKRTLKGDVRNPCCFYQHNGHLYIPDLGARVTILDANDKLVAHLGDGKDVPKEEKDKNPAFIAPHALTVDSRGDLYVIEWVPYGRARKFKHTPQA